MADLAAILKKAVSWYAAGGANVKTFAVSNEEQQVYAVLVVDSPIRKQEAGIVVLARLVNDKIIIEEDTTDRPLVNALIEAGIPREQIVLAYAGDSIPEPHTS